MNAHVNSPRVPFTRDAIARIRAGAGPAELGWDENFYRRVCREQNLEPHGLTPTKPAEIPKAQSRESSDIMAIFRRSWVSRVRREIIIEWNNSGVCKRVARQIGRNAAVMLACLVANEDGYVNSSVIFRAGNIVALPNGGTGANIARALRNILIGTPFDIASAKGPYGGYRLVYSGTKTPAHIRIVSIGDVTFGEDEADI